MHPAAFWSNALGGVIFLILLLVYVYSYVRRTFWVFFGELAIYYMLGVPVCSTVLGDHFACSFYAGGHTSPNPFKEPCLPKGGAQVTDAGERDKVLKQGFSQDKIPAKVDAIIVGSGMGGLTTAAILAKVGKSVLVLEQHDQAGGCCHTFVDKGFEFDTGIHYIGEMAEGTMSRLLVDQLSDGRIEWVQLEPVFDTVVLGMGEASQKKFQIPSGRDKLKQALMEAFPDDEAAIIKYFDLAKRMRRSSQVLPALKMLPQWLAKLVVKSGLLHLLVPDIKFFNKSLTEVLDGITANQELKGVLTYAFGDYGTIPRDASFGMHVMLTNHFMLGTYYPKGGSSEIAFNIIPTIEKAGGRVLVRARVTNILMDETTENVVGVRVKKGHTVYDIMSPVVISDAGLHNTLEHLLPAKGVRKFNLEKLLPRVRHGLGLLSVFIGLEGTKEELGLKASNVWAFKNPNHDETIDKYLKLSPEEIGKSEIPLLFLSFPSTKDPTYNDRYPGKTTCAIITIAPYEWFESWKNEKVMHRGEEYQSLKMAIGKQMWHQVCEMFPQLEDRVEYFDVGTPLSNQFYLGSSQGEVYGIDHNVQRFAPDLFLKLRPEIGIPGLYLTGQDVLVCGFSGAMYGGLLCGSAVLKRNVFQDLFKLKAKMKHVKKQQ